MTTDHPATAVASLAIAPTTLSYSVRQRIFLYLGVLIVLLAFGAPSGGLIDIPISFFLKNKLQLKADEAARILFLVGAAIMATVAVYAAWKPRSVYDNVRTEHGTTAHPLKDVQRLVRHWPIYPALLIWLLWNFAPGSATPLQYYLQNNLHATDAQWGQWNAIFAASFIPTYIIYGMLCRKYALKTLLLWGTVIAVPQLVPLLFI